MTAVANRDAKRLDIGRVVQQTFGILGRNLVPFGVASVLMTGLPALVNALSQMDRYKAAAASGVRTSLFVGGSAGGTGWLGVVGFVLSVVLAPIFFAGLTRAAVQDLDEGSTDVVACLKRGVSDWPGVVGLWILTFLGLMVGFILLFVPGVMLSVAWIVGLPAKVLENLGPVKALGRSAELTRGHRWSIFLLVLIAGVLAAAIELGLFAVGGGMIQMLASPMGLILMPLLTVVLNPIWVAGAAALYHQLRTLRGGFGAQALGEVFA